MEDESGTQQHGRNRDGQTPQGMIGSWVQAEGGKGRRKPEQEWKQTQNAAQGAWTRVGGWRVAGAGNTQVGSASHRERRWGASANKEGFKEWHLWMRGGRKEGEKNDPENGRRKRWYGKAR